MKQPILAILTGLILLLSGCAPVVVGGAAGAGYKLGTDQRTTKQIVKDIDLSDKVTAKLAEDSLTMALSIDVDVVDGYATLSGVVKESRQAKRAVELAQSVDGVRGVRNNLQIGERTFSGRVNDAWISSHIKTQLIATPGIESLNIDVDVYQGVATLTGLVASEQQRRKAIGIARETEGVTRVVDNLRVSSP